MNAIHVDILVAAAGPFKRRFAVDKLGRIEDHHIELLLLAMVIAQYLKDIAFNLSTLPGGKTIKLDMAAGHIQCRL